MTIEDKIKIVENTIVEKNINKLPTLESLYSVTFNLSKKGYDRYVVDSKLKKRLIESYGEKTKDVLCEWFADRMDVHGTYRRRIINESNKIGLDFLVKGFNSWYGNQIVEKILENAFKSEGLLSESFYTHDNITKELLEQYKQNLQEIRKRHYLFDWDDNILMMPTKIKMDKKSGDSWEPIEVSTEEFKEFVTQPNYRLRNNSKEESFPYFRDDRQYLIDVKEAIDKGLFGPSKDKIIEAIKYGNPFAIITARGQSPSIFKKGVKMFIKMVMSNEDKKTMQSNVGDIDKWLDQQEYHPVSSSEFGERFGLDIGASNPEEGKKVAIRDYVANVVDSVEKMIDDGYHGISVGFSDDDVRNINKAEELIRQELLEKYPHIRFVVYDTSDPKNIRKRRIHVEKDDDFNKP